MNKYIAIILFSLLTSSSSAQTSVPLYGYVSATGTDTYAGDASPAITSYVAGYKFIVNFANSNTGAVTININSKGAKSIKKSGAVDLIAGDIPANKWTWLIYDGANFQIDVGTSGGSGIPTGGTIGQVLKKNSNTSGDVSWQTQGGILSGLTTNRIPYATSSTTLGDASELYWDNTNKQLRSGDQTNFGLFFNGQGQFHARRQSGNATIRLSTIGSSGITNYLAFDRSRGTFASPTAIQNADVIGSIVGVGYDGVSSSMLHSPQIFMKASENWNGSSIGSETEFWGVKNATTTQVKYLTIKNDGQLNAPGSSTNSTAALGSIEFQSISVNTALFTDNIYFNGSNFKYRSNGFGELMYLDGGDIRFLTSINGTAGSSATMTDRLKIKNNGAFEINGSAGTSGQVLTSGGSGAVSWTTPGNGDMILSSAQTSTGKKTFSVASNTAGLNIGTTTDPVTSLVNGDIWINSSTSSIVAVVGSTTYRIPYAESNSIGGIDFPNTLANTVSKLVIGGITGAAVGDNIIITDQNGTIPSTDGTLTGYISAANTITLVFTNPTLLAIDPPSTSIKLLRLH